MSLASFKSACLNQAIILARRVIYSVRFAFRPVRVHPTSWVAWRSVLRVNSGGSITIGRHCDIHPFSMLLTHGGHIRIGDHSSVNPFTLIYGCGGATIGSSVRIAAHCVIIPENHNPGTDSVPLHRSGTTRRGIRIDDNVWIGAGVKVLDGVSVGRNCVIGAGTVVTRSAPPGAKILGVPGRIVGAAVNPAETAPGTAARATSPAQ